MSQENLYIHHQTNVPQSSHCRGGEQLHEHYQKLSNLSNPATESIQLQWKADFMNKIHSISCSHFRKFRVRNKNVLSAQFGDDKKERA